MEGLDFRLAVFLGDADVRYLRKHRDRSARAHTVGLHIDGYRRDRAV